MRAYILIGAALATLAACTAIYFTGLAHGEASCQTKTLKTALHEVKNEAQSYANRPRTNDDIIDRLCRLGIDALKREGGSKQQIPIHCRE